MKVFFTASLKGVSFHHKEYLRIFDEIKKLGYYHLEDEILKVTTEGYYKQMEQKGKSAYVDLYKRKIKHLQEADIIVFECSFPSFSIGYMIQKALDFNKPIVILYLKDNIPHFLAGIEENRLIIRNYDLKTIKEVLKDVFEEARERRDKRFNFFISPKLLNYLETVSKQMAITKSTFIRNLIVEHMRKTQEDVKK